MSRDSESWDLTGQIVLCKSIVLIINMKYLASSFLPIKRRLLTNEQFRGQNYSLPIFTDSNDIAPGRYQSATTQHESKTNLGCF